MQAITTDDAPASIGPYSQGIRDGNRVFVSGQGPVDPESGDIVGEDIREQTERTLENVDAICRAAGGSLDDVVKATVFVTDMADYEAVNEVYSAHLSPPYPARSAVEVAALRSTSASRSKSSRRSRSRLSLGETNGHDT